MNTFDSLNLPLPLQEALSRMDYSKPTEIQAQAIPFALEGKDILGSAQTGSGKTAAFSIPLVAKLIEDPTASALILTPTRELAEQVMQVLHQLLNKCPQIKTALLIGGVSIHTQFLRLKARPRVIVGTPGRINDHLQRRSLQLDSAKILVLDEADRMLDMGFGVQLEAIAEYLPTVRQTFMFSATMPKRILALSEKFLTEPLRIKVGATHAPLAKIKQEILRISEDGKFDSLLKELAIRTGSVLIFAKTKRRVDLLASKLNQKMGTGAMHGDLRQHQRTRVLKEFRDQKYRILVATDVAARGLDIPHIEHVINYDLPQAPEDYIHRIGRTARGEMAQGSSLCFISREDEKYWRAIERLLGGDESAPAFARKGGGGRPQQGGRGAPGRQGESYGRRDSDTRARPRFGQDKPFGERRSRGDAPQDNRRAASGKPAFGDRSRGNDNASGERRYSESGRAPFGDRSRSRDGAAAPAGERRYSESGRAPFGDRSRSRDGAAAPAGERRYSENGRAPFSDRSRGRDNSAPFERRTANGSAPFGARSSSRDGAGSGERRRSTSGARPYESAQRPQGQDKPYGERPARTLRQSDAVKARRQTARSAETTSAKPARASMPIKNKFYGPQNRPKHKPLENELEAS